MWKCGKDQVGCGKVQVGCEQWIIGVKTTYTRNQYYVMSNRIRTRIQDTCHILHFSHLDTANIYSPQKKAKS